MNGVWIHTAATSLTMLRLALDPGISLLTSLCFSTFATPIPGPSSIMRSEQAQQRRYDRKHNKPERAKKRRP